MAEERVETIPVTTCQYVAEERVEPYEVRTCQYVAEERVETIPVTTCQYVAEERVEPYEVRTCEMVAEERVETIPVTTCQYVAEERVEPYEVQTCQYVAEERVENIPVTTCQYVSRATGRARARDDLPDGRRDRLAPGSGLRPRAGSGHRQPVRRPRGPAHDRRAAVHDGPGRRPDLPDLPVINRVRESSFAFDHGGTSFRSGAAVCDRLSDANDSRNRHVSGQHCQLPTCPEAQSQSR